MQIDLDFAGRQGVGAREEQQDAYAFSVVVEGSRQHDAKVLLVAVADGMGGYEGGGEASRTAVGAFVEGYFGYLDGLECMAGGIIADGEEEKDRPFSCLALAAGLGAANGALDKLVENDPENLEGAGTTLLGAVVGVDRILWISVGDSPLLLFRDGKLNRLNADHSMRPILAGKIAARQMLPGDLATHPERNVLRSALLGGDIEEVDAPEQPSMLRQGDILVAASDGLLTLEPPEICRILKAGARKKAIFIAQDLLKKVDARHLPKQDNTTVAVVKI